MNEENRQVVKAPTALEVERSTTAKIEAVYAQQNAVNAIKDDEMHKEAVHDWLMRITKTFGVVYSEMLSAILKNQANNNHEECVKLAVLLSDTAEEYFGNYMTWYSHAYPAHAALLMMRLAEAEQAQAALNGGDDGQR